VGGSQGSGWVRLAAAMESYVSAGMESYARGRGRGFGAARAASWKLDAAGWAGSTSPSMGGGWRLPAVVRPGVAQRPANHSPTSVTSALPAHDRANARHTHCTRPGAALQALQRAPGAARRAQRPALSVSACFSVRAQPTQTC
jgi:hypothetical protein